MPKIEDTIEVQVPVQQPYNQWTQFEDFPKFMVSGSAAYREPQAGDDDAREAEDDRERLAEDGAKQQAHA